MKKVMVRAWEIAREGAKKFGGKVIEYLAEALRMAWAEVKMIAKDERGSIQLKGTEKQVKWAEDIRKSVIDKMQEVIEEITERANKKPGRAKAFARYVEVFEEMKNNDSAAFWIEHFGYSKTHFDVVAGFRRHLENLGEENCLQRIHFDTNAAEKLYFKNK